MTYETLLKQYNTPILPLSAISDKYFGITPKRAAADAAQGILPISTFRLRDSTKAPLFVHLEDLAVLIDSRRNSKDF